MASSSYQPEAWHDFYVMAGGSAGALTGLLFVAMVLLLAGLGWGEFLVVPAFIAGVSRRHPAGAAAAGG